jgi:hypothetical protein
MQDNIPALCPKCGSKDFIIIETVCYTGVTDEVDSNKINFIICGSQIDSFDCTNCHHTLIPNEKDIQLNFS